MPKERLAPSLLPLEQDLLYFSRIVKEQPITQFEKPEAKGGARPLPVDSGFAGAALRPAFANVGGAGRDRTDDPLLAKQVLSQLSYSPGPVGGSGWIRTIDPRLIKTVL